MMKYENDETFKNYVSEIIRKHRHRRIYRFSYEQGVYWLKQPDQLRGIWRFLKPNPQLALQNEIKQLKKLIALGVSVPQLIGVGEDFFILEDAGRSANLCIEDSSASAEFKQRVLQDCIKALVELHKKDLIHGRPALRDLVWNEQKVTFIDFEERKESNNLLWLKTRDCLILLHALLRTKVLTTQQEKALCLYFAQCCDKQVWQNVLEMLHRYRWVYYLLLPFRAIARMDLIALYKLFENLVPSLEKQ